MPTEPLLFLPGEKALNELRLEIKQFVLLEIRKLLTELIMPFARDCDLLENRIAALEKRNG